jgi:hypothetical protein
VVEVPLHQVQAGAVGVLVGEVADDQRAAGDDGGEQAAEDAPEEAVVEVVEEAGAPDEVVALVGAEGEDVVVPPGQPRRGRGVPLVDTVDDLEVAGLAVGLVPGDALQRLRGQGLAEGAAQEGEARRGQRAPAGAMESVCQDRVQAGVIGRDGPPWPTSPRMRRSASTGTRLLALLWRPGRERDRPAGAALRVMALFVLDARANAS